jgi:hypothetical protein
MESTKEGVKNNHFASLKDGMPDKWPHACWWCAENFKTPPVGCPCRYDEQRKHMYTTGFMCSFNCARAWGHMNLSTYDTMLLGNWLLLMAKAQVEARGERLDFSNYNIEAAPVPYVMRKYGGPLTLEQFRRQHCSQVRLVCAIAHLKLFPMGYNIFEVPRARNSAFYNEVDEPNVRQEEVAEHVEEKTSTKTKRKRAVTHKPPTKAKRAKACKKDGAAIPPPKARPITELLRNSRKPANRVRADSTLFKMQRPVSSKSANQNNIFAMMGLHRRENANEEKKE